MPTPFARRERDVLGAVEITPWRVQCVELPQIERSVICWYGSGDNCSYDARATSKSASLMNASRQIEKGSITLYQNAPRISNWYRTLLEPQISHDDARPVWAPLP